MLGFATSYWSSTEYNNNNAWYQNFTNGTQNNNNKNNANSVRCIRKSINTLIPMITLEDVFQAYYDCRRNKSRTNNALVFELDYEARLIQLYEDIITGRYHIGRSIAFIVFSPSIREVFAADFRDRIVHHLIYNKINPYFEKTFIYDSYSCRVGRGTRFGIDRIKRFMWQCSKNFSQETYIMKLDIAGFFMNIDRKHLFTELRTYLERAYKGDDIDLIISLCQKIIENDPTRDCSIKGKKEDWDFLPKYKSLFGISPGRGLPIGNLTSQIFGNFYLNSLDHSLKHSRRIRYYGRYVDDMIFLSNDRSSLGEIYEYVRLFLSHNLGLILNDKKTFIGNISDGFELLGVYITPEVEYIGKRTKTNFCTRIHEMKNITQNLDDGGIQRERYQSQIHSYLGLIRQSNGYSLRKKKLQELENTNPIWSTNEEYTKILIQKGALK